MQMPHSEIQVPGLRLCMGMFAAVSFLLGTALALDGNTSMALSNFCGTLFFIFAYCNPTMLQPHGFMKSSIDPRDIVQKKFLWTSLAVGILSLALEFEAHLPLG